MWTLFTLHPVVGTVLLFLLSILNHSLNKNYSFILLRALTCLERRETWMVPPLPFLHLADRSVSWFTVVYFTRCQFPLIWEKRFLVHSGLLYTMSVSSHLREAFLGSQWFTLHDVSFLTSERSVSWFTVVYFTRCQFPHIWEKRFLVHSGLLYTMSVSSHMWRIMVNNNKSKMNFFVNRPYDTDKVTFNFKFNK